MLLSLSGACHSASSSLIRSSSGRLIILTQSVRWMEMPRPRVTNPTISSPGTGLQHLEKRTAKSWIPFTTMPFLDLLAAMGTLPLVSAMPSKILESVISFFCFLRCSSSILLTTWPSFKPPWPMDARTDSQSRNA